MQFINKTGLVLIGAAFLSAPVFVGCDDDRDGTDLTGGSGGTAGTAGTAGSAGSAGEAGSSGAGGDGGGSGGTSGSGGSGGTGGTTNDSDAGGDAATGDAGQIDFNCQPGLGPDGGFATDCAICTTQLQLNVANDGDQDGTCQPAADCLDTIDAVPTGFECCATEFNDYLECFATEPVTSFNCTGGTPQFDLFTSAHGCADEETAFYDCLTAGCP
jgi:hypothetical protein